MGLARLDAASEDTGPTAHRMESERIEVRVTQSKAVCAGTSTQPLIPAALCKTNGNCRYARVARGHAQLEQDS